MRCSTCRLGSLVFACIGLAGCREEREEIAFGSSLGGTGGPGDGGGSGDGIDPGAQDDGPELLDVPDGDDGLDDSAGGGGEGGECPCENVLDGIYVLDATPPASVWFYDPPQNVFTEVGQLGCDAPADAVANSMAIDRSGNAWLNYYAPAGEGFAGWMYRAPLSDLADCTDLGYEGEGAWFLMGMGYAVQAALSSCDTLFLYNSDRYIDYPELGPGGSQLARWDELANDKVVLGETDYPVGELTGTGDGRLYAFATVATNQSILVQLAKGDGEEVESYALDNLDVTHAFAFAFWGGDVFFFTETAPGFGVSKVTRLDLDDTDGGGLEVVNSNAGLHITGAGVSTCASFVPPG